MQNGIKSHCTPHVHRGLNKCINVSRPATAAAVKKPTNVHREFALDLDDIEGDDTG